MIPDDAHTTRVCNRLPVVGVEIRSPYVATTAVTSRRSPPSEIDDIRTPCTESKQLDLELLTPCPSSCIAYANVRVELSVPSRDPSRSRPSRSKSVAAEQLGDSGTATASAAQESNRPLRHATSATSCTESTLA